MILVYVAGSFSATKDEIRRIEERTHTRAEFDVEVRKCVDANIARAVARGLEVARIGLFPVIPHANTAHPDFEKVQPYPFWIDGTMELLFRCDVLVTVPGWEASSGARGEVGQAGEMKMPVFHEIAELEVWKGTLGEVCSRRTRVMLVPEVAE